MKRFIRLMCLVLTLSMVLAMPAMAADRASDYFGSHSCYFWSVSSGGFEVWFNVAAVAGMDTLGASEIKIQRSTDRTNWTTVQTYYNIYEYGTDEAGGHVTFINRQPGYYYRAKVTFYAQNASGVGEYVMQHLTSDLSIMSF